MTDEELIERMAKAIGDELPRDLARTTYASVFARAALSAIRDAGCEIIEREPTDLEIMAERLKAKRVRVKVEDL